MKLLLLVTLAATTLLAADATGKWTGTMMAPSEDGGAGNPLPAFLILTQKGADLTGTAGPSEGEQYPIQNGKVEGGNLTFEVAVGEGSLKIVLKMDGDELKGEGSRDRDGKTQKATISLKRVKP